MSSYANSELKTQKKPQGHSGGVAKKRRNPRDSGVLSEAAGPTYDQHQHHHLQSTFSSNSATSASSSPLPQWMGHGKHAAHSSHSKSKLPLGSSRREVTEDHDLITQTHSSMPAARTYQQKQKHARAIKFMLVACIVLMIAAALVIAAMAGPEHMPSTISAIVNALTPVAHNAILGTAIAVGGLATIGAGYAIYDLRKKPQGRIPVNPDGDYATSSGAASSQRGHDLGDGTRVLEIPHYELEPDMESKRNSGQIKPKQPRSNSMRIFGQSHLHSDDNEEHTGGTYLSYGSSDGDS